MAPRRLSDVERPAQVPLQSKKVIRVPGGAVRHKGHPAPVTLPSRRLGQREAPDVIRLAETEKNCLKMIKNAFKYREMGIGSQGREILTNINFSET